jgi:hypothetical protein
MPLIVGIDGGWKGTGWAIANQAGPIEAGWIELDRSWRKALLRDFLAALLSRAEHHQAQIPQPAPPPRLVVEKPPMVYSGRGNQAATGFGIGDLVGACELAGIRPGWAYPWTVPVGPTPAPDNAKKRQAWRQWWGIAAKGRGSFKQHAYLYVRATWPSAIAPFNREPLDGPRGDVAEAILLAVGAAKHSADAPKGPRSWRARGCAPGRLGGSLPPAVLPLAHAQPTNRGRS